jgi:hypothetical protein
MDAAIGRLHLSITVAQPVTREEPAPKLHEHKLERKLERALRRHHGERAAEADRAMWSAEYHGQGRLY